MKNSWIRREDLDRSGRDFLPKVHKRVLEGVAAWCFTSAQEPPHPSGFFRAFCWPAFFEGETNGGTPSTKIIRPAISG